MSHDAAQYREVVAASRRRLHKSSVVVGCIALVLGGILVLSGETPHHVPFVHQYVFPVEVNHGWPLTFLEREVDLPSAWNNAPRRNDYYPDYGLWGIPWLSTGSWAFWDASRSKFSSWAASADAVVLLSFVGAVTAAMEWRRRRRFRFFQFRIWEVLLAFAVVGAFTGWFAWHRREHARERIHALAIDEAAPDFPINVLLSGDDRSPLWLTWSLGWSNVPESFNRIGYAGVQFNGETEPGDVPWLLSHLTAFKRLHTLDIGAENEDQVGAIILGLGPVRALREINIDDWGDVQFGLAQARYLSNLRQVTKVAFTGQNLHQDAYDYLRREMPWCEFVWRR